MLKQNEYITPRNYEIPALLNINVFAVGFAESDLAGITALIAKNGGALTSVIFAADVIVSEKDVDISQHKHLTDKEEITVTYQWLLETEKQNKFCNFEDFKFKSRLFIDELDDLMGKSGSSSLFQQKIFHLSNLNDDVSDKLFRLLSQHGALVVQKLVPQVNFIVSEFLRPEFQNELTDMLEINLVKPVFVKESINLGVLADYMRYGPSEYPTIRKFEELKEFEDRIKSKVFSGYVFSIVEKGYSPFELTSIKKQIIENSGSVVDHVENTEEMFSNITHFVACDGYFKAIFKTWNSRILVSHRFISYCIEKDKMINVDDTIYNNQVQLRPLPLETPVLEMRKMKISITGDDEESNVLKHILKIFVGESCSKKC